MSRSRIVISAAAGALFAAALWWEEASVGVPLRPAFLDPGTPPRWAYFAELRSR